MISEIVDTIYKAHKRLTEMEQKPRDYGTGELLYSSEVHTICVIVANPGINLTEIANIMEITKASVSKFVSKLLKKEYIVKKKGEGNLKEVYFFPTDLADKVFKGHRQFKENTFGPLYNLEVGLDPESYQVIKVFIDELYCCLDETN